MRIVTCICSLAVAAGLCGSALAQFKEGSDEPTGGVKLGDAKVQRWQCGLELKAVGGPCRNIVGYIPFPAEWPEQSLRIVEENIAREARVTYETLNETVKLMVVKIANLPGGQEAKATVTFEVRRNVILAPEDTSIYKLPDAKKIDLRIRQFLQPSPKIESTHPRIRELAREVGMDKESAWEHVEAIYDHVRDVVKYQNGPLKGAVAALKDGTGDCEELTSLFIAICRAANIPARSVWVPGHCYPEFYLIDADGKGHWFPCQAAGTRAFGQIPETRPILQKGDNFRPPWNKKEAQRYLAEYLTGSPIANGGKPQVKFIREIVAD